MIQRLVVLCLASTLLPATILAQDATEKAQDSSAERKSSRTFDPAILDCGKQATRSQISDCSVARSRDYTIQLTNATNQNDANEILVAIRNLVDPGVKIFLSASQSILSIHTYPEEFARIRAIAATLDLPHPTYRVTYTLTESDAGKRLGVQHFSFIAAAGQRIVIKQGSKIPVSTGKYDDGKSGTQTQFTYLDIGANFDSTVSPAGKNVLLKSKIEQSSAVENTTLAGVVEPIVRQSVIDGVAVFVLGKSVNIGALDVPGSTRHVEVDALIEPL